MPGSKHVEDMTRLGGMGLHFAATIAVFGGGGYWLDSRLGSSPWLLIVGVFLGFGLGLYSMVLKLGPAGSGSGRSESTSDSSPERDPPDR